MNTQTTDEKVTLRPATAADQAIIVQIIEEADINPNNLDWERFLLAEIDGQVVGTGQVKPHKDGTRELASIAVRPAHQRKGIASLIIHALLAREIELLYLMCEEAAESFYQRFGFRRLSVNEMPRELGKIRRAIKIRWPEFEPSIMKQTEEGSKADQD
jgi:N-acetylglutamate synthase-like GNAT family acetyltransferase